MRISEITVDSFGHWKDLKVSDLSSEVTVIHGPNEAGKSTLLQLLRAVLYGFSPAQHHRFVPPLHEGRVGGTIHVAAPNGRFRVRRWLPKSGILDEHDQNELSVESVDGTLKGRHLLNSLLAGVDESIFQNVFAVGLSEMQQLGTLSDTEAANQLYGLASGTDRVSLAEVAQQLEVGRDQLLSSEEIVNNLEQLVERSEELRQELEVHSLPTDRWFKLNEERQRITDELQELEGRQENVSGIHSSEPNQVIRDHWQACVELKQKLESVGPIPDIPDDSLKRLAGLVSEINDLRQQWEAKRSDRRQLKENGQGLVGNKPLLQHAEPINGLNSQRSQVVQLEEDVERLAGKAEESDFELQAEIERLGIKSGSRLGAMPVITHEMVAALRPLARTARDARRHLESLSEQNQAAAEKVDAVETKMANALKNTKHETVTDLLNDGQQQVNDLVERIEIDNRIVKLERSLKEAREEAGHWNQRKVLPWRTLMMLGAIFSIGIAVVLVALFGPMFGIGPDRRFFVSILGGSLCFAAAIIKKVLSFVASKSFDSCQAEAQEIMTELTSLQAAAATLEARLPAGSGPLAVLLQSKQDDLTRFQKLKPLESQRVAAVEEVASANSQIADAKVQLNQARRAWRERLHAFDLPSSMTPTQFRQFSQAEGKLGKLRETHQQVLQELAASQEQLQTLSQRVQLVRQRVGHEFQSQTLEPQISELVEALQAAQRQKQDREGMHRQWRELGREQEKIARAAKRLQEKKKRLIDRHNVVDVKDFKTLIQRKEAASKLRNQIDKQLVEISAQLGEAFKKSELRKMLSKGGFEGKLQKLESDHRQVSNRVAKLLERRGELNAKLSDLSQDRKHCETRLELEIVRQQIRDRSQHWALLAGVSRALDTVRISYESERQPETLADASSYLKRLTGGRYRRIWTPFGESSLRVDDQQDRTVQVESLSRGTREQVFLSLRLALAAVYARRGAALPVILDDVFVNFDAKRARSAAEAICEYATAGRQVLIFTCHDHIHDLFLELGVDVRTLPTPDDVVVHGAVVAPTSLSLDSKVAPASSGLHQDDLDPELDPELEYELTYGAPEYDPGYEPEMDEGELSDGDPQRTSHDRDLSIGSAR